MNRLALSLLACCLVPASPAMARPAAAPAVLALSPLPLSAVQTAQWSEASGDAARLHRIQSSDEDAGDEA